MTKEAFSQKLCRCAEFLAINSKRTFMSSEYDEYAFDEYVYEGDVIFQTNKAFTELDSQIMKLNARLRCTTAYLEVKKNDTKQRMRDLTDKRNKVESELTSICGYIRSEKQRMRMEQKGEMARLRQQYLTERDTIAKKLESQLRFRKSEWVIGDESIFNQIDALIDLIQYSREQLPFSDREPYLFIHKTLDSNLQGCESAKLRLRSLYLEVESANHRMGKTLKDVNRRQKKLHRNIERRQEKFDVFCDLFNEEEAKMKVAIEQSFRKILHTESQKTRAAQYNATTRFSEAKASAEQLEQKRDKFKKLQCPQPAAKNYLSEAKMRVARVLLTRLQDENQQLKKALEDLAPFRSSSSTIASISSDTTS